MKKLLLFSLLFFTINSFSQSITRGPDLGEIYFLGPTHTTNGLYYSTDFGETAICVDSVKNIATIAADKTSGGIYCYTYPVSLYYSSNYGFANSWEFKNADVSANINSGTIPGYIFSGCYMHSENYGVNFIYHSLNGYFGEPKKVTIDNIDINYGYVITYKLDVGDSVYLFTTSDKFENVNLIQKFNYLWYEVIALSRGFNAGEVFMFNFTRNNLWVSYDYFDNMQLIDTFNIRDFAGVGIEGGNETGELYLRYSFSNLMQQNRQLYIFHSMDYGRTFEVFHPFSKGNQPVLANFSSDTTKGEKPFAVDFCNFSIGEIIEYQWDFDNDGSIDSYEQSPLYTYQDTGYFTVKLTVVGSDSSNTFIKENYIYVYDSLGTFITEQLGDETVNCFPNPFTEQITIQLPENISKNNITVKIYNSSGKIIKTFFPVSNTIIWKGKDNRGNIVKPGVYYCLVNTENPIIKKLVLTF